MQYVMGLMSRYLEKINMMNVSLYWNKIRRPLTAVAVGGFLAVSLQGCFLLAGTAIVGGTFASVDRRTLGAQTEDKSIVVKGLARMQNVVAAGSHVNVTSFNRRVLLSGEVPDAASKEAAEREIKNMEGVLGVFNELEIAGASGFGARSNDTLVTSKVVASLVDAQDLSAHVFKVTTERGIVYLMGRVTQNEGTRAANIASGVSGVQRVVTLFEYISETEVREFERNKDEQQPAAVEARS
jgi:osmotically-inducible protein OsmY